MARALFGARRDVAARSDGELVELSRSGEKDAYAELWRRHASAGLAVARAHSPSLDADDLVSESFARIFTAIASGGGPTAAFRPYLFTTIRNTAAGWGRARREIPVDDVDLIEDPRFTDDAQLKALDGSLAMEAFRSLSAEWQEVLWYTEVEGLAPRELAPLLGLTANSAAALAYRAREGLRQAWIQAHIASVPADSECRWTIEHLGAHLRGKTPKRTRLRVEQHLAGCADCTMAAGDAKDANRQVGLALLPLAAGMGGAAAYTAWMSTGGATGAATAATLPAAGTGTAGTAGTAGSAGSVSGTAVLVGAGLVLGAVAVAGVAVSPSALPTPTPTPDAPTAAPHAPAAPPLGVPQVPVAAASIPPAAPAPAPAPTRTPTPTSSPTPTEPAVQAPDAPTIVSPSPTSALRTGEDTIVVSGTGTPGARLTASFDDHPVAIATVDGSGAWSLSLPTAALADGPHTLSLVQATASGASKAATLQVVIARSPVAPDAPVVSAVDTGGGRYFPVLSGTAFPGATVTIQSVAATETATSTATADASGAWTSAAITGLPAGTDTLNVTQTDAQGQVSPVTSATAVLTVPAVAVDRTREGVALTVTGVPGAQVAGRITASGSWVTVTLDADGRWSGTLPWWTDFGNRTLQLRYAGDGRVGPVASVPLGGAAPSGNG
jgi:RNA polymerase sigma factor (sigma-70 family)